MAISPPSDIVLEVSRAADPDRLRVATAKLEKLGESAAIGFTDFASAMPAAGRVRPPVAAGYGEASPPFDLARARLKLRNDTAETTRVATVVQGEDRRTQAMRGFEAMVLQTFIGSMLPENSGDVFGEGTAGDVWRSMLAEQLAQATAKSGGIGIADRLLASAAPAVPLSSTVSRL